ncbi:hypothetical protein EDB83DRAFT_2343895 [Lactarius deliciosus]|nr:hypothetical protein EDB83DRAFT_2343895 [Lactarius deliciosus]
MTWAVRVPVFKFISARSLLVFALVYNVWHPLFGSGMVSGQCVTFKTPSCSSRFPHYLLYTAPLMSIIHETVPFQLLNTRIYLFSMVDQLRSPRPDVIAAAVTRREVDNIGTNHCLVTGHRSLVTEDNQEFPHEVSHSPTILTLLDRIPPKFENITLFFK